MITVSDYFKISVVINSYAAEFKKVSQIHFQLPAADIDLNTSVRMVLHPS